MLCINAPKQHWLFIKLLCRGTRPPRNGTHTTGSRDKIMLAQDNIKSLMLCSSRYLLFTLRRQFDVYHDGTRRDAAGFSTWYTVNKGVSSGGLVILIPSLIQYYLLDCITLPLTVLALHDAFCGSTLSIPD